MIDAIEADDDEEILEELGDLLLQVVFHAQIADERGAFNFDKVCRSITNKLIRRHPHVFEGVKVKNVDGAWHQWDAIKRLEKAGTARERKSEFDGIPKHLPELMRAHEVVKKARKADLLPKGRKVFAKRKLGEELFKLVQKAQANGWQAEELLREEIKTHEKVFRAKEKARQGRKRD